MSLTHSRRRPARRMLRFDALESRRLLCGDNCLEIPLMPEIDQFGAQIQTVMGYRSAGQSDEQTPFWFALYDTGASVVTLSAAEQTNLAIAFDLGLSIVPPVPIKVPGGATADAIGGTLVGDVSEPGEIIADGLHASQLSFDVDLNSEMGIDLSGAVRSPDVQMFVGTETGSAALPTITGTVIHDPSPAHPSGTAALIDMTAYKFDFGELFGDIPEFADLFAGIVIEMPDLRFVEPGTQLAAPTDGSVSEIVRIPLEMWGENNHASPGNSITYSENPVQTSTSFSLGDVTSSGHTMLFDTGAQLSVISTAIALELGIDLENPSAVITVQGAAGTAEIPGFTIDVLEMPRDDNGDGVSDGTLRFTNVPIYVLDVVPGLDGILGMNLFNVAHSMLYDPHDPAGASLQVAFFTDLLREIPEVPEEEQMAIDLVSGAFPALTGSFGGQSLPSFGLDVPIPNQPPTSVSLARREVFADTPGAWVGKLATVDADTADIHTYFVSDARFEVRDRQLYLQAGASLNAGTEPSITLEITATDSGSPAKSVTSSITLTVLSRPPDWTHAYQWKPRIHDVNVDGAVTPLDALLIINELNAERPTDFPSLAGGTLSGPFFDVSGDDKLTPLDALLIINLLNSGEEGEPASGSDSTKVDDDDVRDAALLWLLQEDEEDSL